MFHWKFNGYPSFKNAKIYICLFLQKIHDVVKWSHFTVLSLHTHSEGCLPAETNLADAKTAHMHDKGIRWINRTRRRT